MDKIKILIGILSYGGGNNIFKEDNLHKRGYLNQDKYLFEILENYNTWDKTKYQIDLVIFCTSPYDITQYSNINFLPPQIYDENITVNLGWQHRDYFIKNQDNYDFFIWGENDMLITEETFNTWNELDSNLKVERSIIGLICWEEHKNGEGYAFQTFPRFQSTPTPIREIIESEEDTYIHFTNPQSACYIIDRFKLKTLINEDLYTPSTINPKKEFKNGNNKWVEKFGDWGFPGGDKRGYIRSQPSCASEIYCKGRFRKLVSLKNYKKLLAIHLPNIYIHGKNGCDFNKCMSETDLNKLQSKYIKNEI